MAAPLSAASKKLLDQEKSRPPTNYDDISVEQIRKIIKMQALATVRDWTFSGTTEEQKVKMTQGDVKEIPITVSRPEGRHCFDNILVYFHGGGFVWGSMIEVQAICEMIASTSKCVVVNVEYGLSPENKYPSCYKEGQAVIQWCIDNRQELSCGNDKCIVGVGGDSVGGRIGASACHEMKGIAYQVFIHTTFDMDPSSYPSYQVYGKGYRITDALLEWFAKQHLNHPATEKQEPLASPMRRSDFTGIPPALFIVAECDPTADQSWGYKKKMDEAGVVTDSLVVKGALHAFINKYSMYKEEFNLLLQKMNEFFTRINPSDSR